MTTLSRRSIFGAVAATAISATTPTSAAKNNPMPKHENWPDDYELLTLCIKSRHDLADYLDAHGCSEFAKLVREAVSA